MTKIYLFKNYKNNVEGEIIEVSDEIATKLVKKGLARLTGVRDFLVKPQTGIKKVITRALFKSPKIK